MEQIKCIFCTGAISLLGTTPIDLFVLPDTWLYFPASLCSTIVTRFFAPTDALTPADSFVAAHRGSLIHVI